MRTGDFELQRSRLLLRLVGIVLSLSIVLAAQEPVQSRPARPRVGLALSGGGALGLAHIGVIQYFEERRIPIDRVAGTSMGGLVGGFYAAGMNSRELKQIVDKADWNYLLSPNPRFVDQPVVEKQRWNRTFGNLTLRFGRRFSLPAGLNPGESLSLLLSRNTLAYAELASFDELPTPFRCVATDLISGDGVVLASGSLPKAMRATMALPAVFTPVKWEDKLLIDGGLVQNVPVEVVREMGADVAVAVVLDTPKAKAEQFNSLLTVLRQTATIAVIQNERRSSALADLVITVKTENYSGTDYAKASDLIVAGYDAAKAKAAELSRFELSPGEWDAYIRARQQRTRHAPGKGPVLEVAAARASFQKNAEAEIRRKLGAGPVENGEVEDVLSGIVAATGVPGASYQWKSAPAAGKSAPAGAEGYRVEFMERPDERILVRPSFHFGVSSGEPSRAALNLSISTVPANTYKSRFLGMINIGYDPRLQAEYYHPFNGTGYFIAPGFVVERFQMNAYDGGTRTSGIRDRFGASFYGGIGTWRFVQLRVGVQAGYDSYSRPVDVDGVRARSHGFANPEVVWLYNTQDSGGLPYRGTRIEGSAGYSFRNTSFPYFRNEFSTFVPVSRSLSLFGLGTAGTSFGTKLNYYEQFAVGGVSQLSAFRYQEFHANSAVTAGGGVIIHGQSVRSLSLYPGLALWYEAGRMDLGSRGWQTRQSTSAGVFFPTPLGAAAFGLSFNESGKARFRLSLGSLGR